MFHQASVVSAFHRLKYCLPLLLFCWVPLLRAAEDSIAGQLLDSLSGADIKFSAWAHFEDDEEDDINYPMELLIRQEIDLDFSDSWSFFAETEYRADNRHFTAGVLDEINETSQRRYHLNFREAYVRYAGSKADFYVGKKIYAWGKADGFNPVDNLNPYDNLDFINNAKQGIVSAAVSVFGDASGFDLVWVPFFTPSRTPDFDNRWIIDVTSLLPGNGVGFVPAETQYPSRTIDNSQVGLRLWANRWGFDLALTAYKGFDPIPAVQFNLDLDTGLINAAPSFNEIEEYGLSAVKVVGNTTFHFEGSYRITEADYDDDFFSYVIGLNRSFYVGGRVEELRIVAEWVDEAWIDYKENASRLTTPLSRPFRDTLLSELNFIISGGTEAKVRVAYNVEDQDYLVQPQVKFDISDSVNLELGLDIIEGDPGTFWGNWAHNDRFFTHLSWFF